MMQEVAAEIARAESILFITGAGLSADSGIPTYRGIGGLYNDADTDDGMPIELALSGEMLRRRPEIPWRYITQIESACRDKRHNRGHEVIAALESSGRHTCVLTQNIDGFHSDAGSRNLIEMHGNIRRIHCTRCNYREEPADYSQFTMLPPHCPECDALLRPEVVLFGEMLPLPEIRQLEQELDRGFDLIFTIGTTSVFPYIAEPVLQASRRGIPTVEINPGKSEVSAAVRYRLRSGAAQSLNTIYTFLQR